MNMERERKKNTFHFYNSLFFLPIFKRNERKTNNLKIDWNEVKKEIQTYRRIVCFVWNWVIFFSKITDINEHEENYPHSFGYIDKGNTVGREIRKWFGLVSRRHKCNVCGTGATVFWVHIVKSIPHCIDINRVNDEFSFSLSPSLCIFR